MRLPIILMLIVLLLSGTIDYYIYRVVKRYTKSPVWIRVHTYSAIFMMSFLIVSISLPRRNGSDDMLLSIMWALFAYVSIYIPKLLFIIFDALSYLPKLWKKTRVNVMTIAGLCVAVITFILMWWGALINRYSIDVEEVQVGISGLPKEFDGYRIAQISDLHVGTYGDDDAFIKELVEEINSLDVDLVVFTGDIVNRNTRELLPFVDALSRLKAHDGVVSILGNHDYGDYSDWKSDAEKQENMRLMYSLQKGMGWNLLLNETQMIYSGNDSIAIIGVENVGEPPFKVYGSLDDAYPTLGDDVTKILLSHNPAHWVNDIKGNEEINIALTLSGHTHAMQMSFGRFSPAALRYETWGGFYESDDKKRNLYVNVGVGTVAVPVRVGATPEITLLTLKSVKNE